MSTMAEVRGRSQTSMANLIAALPVSEDPIVVFGTSLLLSRCVGVGVGVGVSVVCVYVYLVVCACCMCVCLLFLWVYVPVGCRCASRVSRVCVRLCVGVFAIMCVTLLSPSLLLPTAMCTLCSLCGGMYICCLRVHSYLHVHRLVFYFFASSFFFCMLSKRVSPTDWNLPKVALDTLAHIESAGLSEVGIMRLSGSTAEIQVRARR
jgi:hypothetical protein